MANIGNLARMERDNPQFCGELVQMVNEFGQGGAARHYGVSQSAVCQYLRKRGATVVKVWKLTDEGRGVAAADKTTDAGYVAAELMHEAAAQTVLLYVKHADGVVTAAPVGEVLS